MQLEGGGERGVIAGSPRKALGSQLYNRQQHNHHQGLQRGGQEGDQNWQQQQQEERQRGQQDAFPGTEQLSPPGKRRRTLQLEASGSAAAAAAIAPARPSPLLLPTASSLPPLPPLSSDWLPPQTATNPRASIHALPSRPQAPGPAPAAAGVRDASPKKARRQAKPPPRPSELLLPITQPKVTRFRGEREAEKTWKSSEELSCIHPPS